jgi:hypothetical protein
LCLNYWWLLPRGAEKWLLDAVGVRLNLYEGSANAEVGRPEQR